MPDVIALEGSNICIAFPMTGEIAPPPRRRFRRRPVTRPATPIVETVESAVWAANSGRLADAALDLLNRRDCCGGYRGTRVTTRKEGDSDWTPLYAALQWHFRGRPNRTLGLHAIDKWQRCRWLAFDLDAHNGEDPADNLDAANLIVERLARHGLTGHIFDSDGRGGLHVWAKFPIPRPASAAYDLARRMADGLDAECFPKQREVPAGRFGNWIRLPGKHYKRPHWSRVWMGDRWGTPQETVDVVLAMCSG